VEERAVDEHDRRARRIQRACRRKRGNAPDLEVILGSAREQMRNRSPERRNEERLQIAVRRTRRLIIPPRPQTVRVIPSDAAITCVLPPRSRTIAWHSATR
jgi:hypothetical protein